MSQYGYPPVGGGLFEVITTMFPFLFILVIGIVTTIIVVSIARNTKNRLSPKETVYATIVSKRMYMEHHSNHHAGGHLSTYGSRTNYYITLQFQNGERREYLDVKKLFSLVAEGDSGYALVQGEWLIGFERSMSNQKQAHSSQ